MASIVKRRNKFCVVYYCLDSKGNKRQKWESFTTNSEAKKRKAEIEMASTQGFVVVPEAKTVRELMEEYMSIYGRNNWAVSTFGAKRSLYNNYIDPLIGKMQISTITTRVMDQYYQNLMRVRTKVVNNRTPKNDYLTPHTIREIHKLLRSCFNQAVKWELISKNPCENATIPKEIHEKREIWDMDTLKRALEICDDEILRLALHLGFSCSMRVGEIIGLTWDCVDISEGAIECGESFVFINKEIRRVNRDVLSILSQKDVMFQFPSLYGKTSTVLVLKKPKTETSIRKVFLPETVARMLQERREKVREYKELLGDEFFDYNLVFCMSNGRPLESNTINRLLDEFIKKNDFPKVVFHSIRHSSITYKLRISGGDIKTVQGDSGHAQATMVTEQYAHILDEDRRKIAQKLDKEFYKNEDDSKTNQSSSNPNESEAIDLENLKMLAKLLSNPQTAELLKALTKNI